LNEPFRQNRPEELQKESIMRNTAVALSALLLVSGAGLRASGPAAATSVSGDYVEARTAEVFAGGCILGSEGEPSGREAILAWRVDQGQVNGVSLDGLSVVAVVAGDTSLGMHEIGGAAPRAVKAALRVDNRANAEQRDALIALARTLAPAVVNDIVDVKAVPIEFDRDAHHVAVQAGEAALDVAAHMHHDPACGALQWFDPLAATTHADLGVTRTQRWSGSSLGSQWDQTDRKSSFIGTFALGR
jgi:hypothetical protein